MKNQIPGISQKQLEQQIEQVTSNAWKDATVETTSSL